MNSLNAVRVHVGTHQRPEFSRSNTRRSAATEYEQLKMMESSIKWSMNRDEQRQVKHEKIADAAEIMNRRQQ